MRLLNTKQYCLILILLFSGLLIWLNFYLIDGTWSFVSNILISSNNVNSNKESSRTQLLSDVDKSPDVEPNILNNDHLKKVLKRKYIGCNVGYVGGLGNQIWRFASLYGIGRIVDREPFFEPTNVDQMKNMPEIARVFPKMAEIVHIKAPTSKLLKKYHFADDCCKFDDPKKLLDKPEKYIKIFGNYLQSYKFYHSFRNEIREILTCGSDVMKIVNFFAKNTFKGDENHKMCVHVRRGDFIKDIMLETTKEFTVPAIKFAFDYIGNKIGSTKISLIFIGNDPEFVHTLSIPKLFTGTYSSEKLSRGEDICFGIHHCDSMIMTASGSTFSWWISYLMKPGSIIFYNSQVTNFANFSKDFHDFDIFPPDWIKLTVRNGVAELETNWWYQKKPKIA